LTIAILTPVLDQFANSNLKEMDMHDKSVGPMNVENVEDFDVRIFNSQDLFVTVVSHHASRSVITEQYEIKKRSIFDRRTTKKSRKADGSA